MYYGSDLRHMGGGGGEVGVVGTCIQSGQGSLRGQRSARGHHGLTKVRESSYRS